MGPVAAAKQRKPPTVVLSKAGMNRAGVYCVASMIGRQVEFVLVL